MEAVCFCETPVNFYEAICHNNPEDDTLEICLGNVETKEEFFLGSPFILGN
jgi:hypothetical protein